MRILKLYLLKQKLKREHYSKGTLRKQSNKHQNSQKAMLRTENKKLPVACLRQLFHLILRLFSRGGVEDTRLEAKAKDTKKYEAKAKDSLSEDRPSRGQGQKCSRPRTKDTEASVLQKKKVSNFFFWRSPIHRHTQNF